MSKARKDMITIYMFRNALATLFAAFASFMISLIHYYQCTFAEALQRLFMIFMKKKSLSCHVLLYWFYVGLFSLFLS